MKPLRVALVGCGQIADAHLQEIAKIDGACVVAVCDQQPDLAEQLAVRFGVARRFTSLDRMLDDVAPDVVHVTTPPHTHLPVALRCIEAGAHVYVEKPFTIDVDEADRLLSAAAGMRRLVSVGHDQLFQPVWTETTALIRSGALGEIVHVDCVRGYDLQGPYGSLISSDRRHWIHKLPGGIFQNVISHVVCLVAPFLSEADRSVDAFWFGGDDLSALPTELRASLRSGGVTASIVMSSRARPVQRIARIFGTCGTVEADFDSGLLRRVRSPRLPGAFGRLEAPFTRGLDAFRHLTTNMRRFARSELQYFAGMNQLFRAFYTAIDTGSASPTPPADILDVTAIMDEIFVKCSARRTTRRGAA